jgi:hypothetical protein
VADKRHGRPVIGRGAGANGKTTFAETLGTYGVTVGAETF